MAVCEGTPAPIGQLTDQPFGFERIAEPGLRPAMRNAGADKSGMKMLPFPIEERKLSARLVEATRQIAALDRVRPPIGLGMIVYG